MFGTASKKQKLEPKVKWDDWNERFESPNGNTFTMEALGNLVFHSEDMGNEVTVKGFLKFLLSTLWDEEETFNAKRPFGSSGWKDDMMVAFIDRGIIEGLLDSHGELQTADVTTFNYVVSMFIKKGM